MGDVAEFLISRARLEEATANDVANIFRQNHILCRAALLDPSYAEILEKVYSAMEAGEYKACAKDVKDAVADAMLPPSFVPSDAIKGLPQHLKRLAELENEWARDAELKGLPLPDEGAEHPPQEIARYFQLLVADHCGLVDAKRKVLAAMMAVYKLPQGKVEYVIRKYYQETMKAIQAAWEATKTTRPPAPCPTVALYSFKGGVAKTTTCVNLAAALAKEGWRVGVVDADSQGNATSYFLARYDQVDGHQQPVDAEVMAKLFDTVDSDNDQLTCDKYILADKLADLKLKDLIPEGVRKLAQKHGMSTDSNTRSRALKPELKKILVDKMLKDPQFASEEANVTHYKPKYVEGKHKKRDDDDNTEVKDSKSAILTVCEDDQEPVVAYEPRMNVPDFACGNLDGVQLPFLVDKLEEMTKSDADARDAETDDFFKMHPLDDLPGIFLLCGGPMRDGNNVKHGFETVEERISGALRDTAPKIATHDDHGAKVASMRKLLSGAGRFNDLDIILVDVGPSDSLLNSWMVMSCDFLLPPSFCDHSSGETVASFVNHVYPTFRKRQDKWTRQAARGAAVSRTGDLMEWRHGPWTKGTSDNLFNPLTRVLPVLISGFQLNIQEKSKVRAMQGAVEGMIGITTLLQTSLLQPSNFDTPRPLTRLEWVPYKENALTSTIKYDIRFLKRIDALIMASHHLHRPIPSIPISCLKKKEIKAELLYANKRYQMLANLIRDVICREDLGDRADLKQKLNDAPKRDLKNIASDETPWNSNKLSIEELEGNNKMLGEVVRMLVQAIESILLDDKEVVTSVNVVKSNSECSAPVFKPGSETKIMCKIMDEICKNDKLVRDRLTHQGEDKRRKQFQHSPHCKAQMENNDRRTAPCIDILLQNIFHDDSTQEEHAGWQHVGVELKNERPNKFKSFANFEVHFNQVNKYARAYEVKHIFLINLATGREAEDELPYTILYGETTMVNKTCCISNGQMDDGANDGSSSHDCRAFMGHGLREITMRNAAAENSLRRSQRARK